MGRRSPRFAWLLPGLVVALASCPSTPSGDAQNPPPACGKSCGHGTTGAHAGSGSSGAKSSSPSSTVATATGSSGTGVTSSAGPAGSSSSSSSSSSAPSSSGGGNGSDLTRETFCPGIAIPPGTAQCPGGSPFASQLVDGLECSEIGGAQVGAIGENGVPIAGAAATSAGDGAFAVCLPEDVAFSIQITVASYPTTYYAEMLNVDAGYIAQMPMVSSGELFALQAFLPHGYDANKALMLVKLTGETELYDGWSFSIALPDGGAVPDGGYSLVYLGNSSTPDPTATATTGTGAALYYNVDPTLSSFYLISASNADAGSASEVQNAAEGFTGRVYVAGGAVTVDPILLP